MSLVKKHLEFADIDRETIEKFAAQFPNGTDVTYDVCVGHPDIFSFGLHGLPIVPFWHRVSYGEEICRATLDYYSKVYEIKLIYGRKWIAPDSLVRENSDIGIFKWGDTMPSNRLRPLTTPEMNVLNEKLREANNEYRLKQAIAFYNAHKMGHKLQD